MGNWSLAQQQFGEAVRHYEAGLAILDTYLPDWHARRCQVLLAIASAEDRSADQSVVIAAYDRLRRAANISAAAAAERLDARAGSASAGRILAFGALATQMPNDGGAFFGRRSAAAATLVADLALETARRIGDISMVASALLGTCWRFMDVDRVGRRIDESAEIVAAAVARGDAELELEGRMLRIYYLLLAGRVRAVDAEIDAYAVTATRVPASIYAWFLHALRAARAHIDGRFAEAQEHASRLAQRTDGIPQELVDSLVSSQLFAIRISCGDTGADLPILEAFVAAYPHQTAVRTVITGALCELGRFDEARAHFALLAADDFRVVFDTPLTWFATAGGLARVCNRLAARGPAATLYRLLLPYADVCLVSPVGLNFYGSMHGCLGMLAATMGRRRDALAHFEAAHGRNARAYAWPARAHIQYEHARFLLQCNQRRDAPQVHALLREAHIAATDMQMSRLVEWIDAL